MRFEIPALYFVTAIVLSDLSFSLNDFISSPFAVGEIFTTESSVREATNAASNVASLSYFFHGFGCVPTTIWQSPPVSSVMVRCVV